MPAAESLTEFHNEKTIPSRSEKPSDRVAGATGVLGAGIHLASASVSMYAVTPMYIVAPIFRRWSRRNNREALCPQLRTSMNILRGFRSPM